MIVWKYGGLIFDLRSPSERKEDLAQYWMNHPTTTTKLWWIDTNII